MLILLDTDYVLLMSTATENSKNCIHYLDSNLWGCDFYHVCCLISIGGNSSKQVTLMNINVLLFFFFFGRGGMWGRQIVNASFVYMPDIRLKAVDLNKGNSVIY